MNAFCNLRNTLLLTAVLLLSNSAFADESVIVHHNLSVNYQPNSHEVEVTDSMQLPSPLSKKALTFKLHSALKPIILSPGTSLSVINSKANGIDKGMDQEADNQVPLTEYEIHFDKNIAADKHQIKISYSGIINQVIAQQGEEYSRGFSQTSGIIDDRGAYLAGSTYWIPSFGDEYVTYELSVSSPKDWSVVSQGKRVESKDIGSSHLDVWSVNTPTEEIYLIGAKFSEYSFDVGAVKAMAFLRSDDEALANKYLETTAQYMEMYRNLIGPYPYSKFALVENFWETGYGMPSFTLLGEKIIRFPFILHSSYPHELLHNWWGNSVYVDFDQGNWCEGLTAYMADQLIAEQRGKAAAYRRSTLQGFTDYVDDKTDFPLNKFVSRFSPASSAIGYGKSAMMWDMLREKVGDENFNRALQRFYQENKFKRASFTDIKNAFESVTNTQLDEFFAQWTERKGAPELKLSDVKMQQKNKNYKLDFTLQQLQKEAVFNLDVPVAIYSKDSVKIHKVKMTSKNQKYSITMDHKPVKVQVDPQFNLFRKLHFSEIPPSLSKIFGADKVTIILPSEATSAEQQRYHQLAQIWSKNSDKFKIVKDTELKSLPKDRSIWIFGWNNQYRSIVEQQLKNLDGEISADQVRLGKVVLDKKDNSFIIGVRHPKDPNLVAVWVTAHDADAVAGLARKLPHYGKYSYLAFTGKEPTNVAKGQWPTVNSPLIKVLEKIDLSKVKLKKRPALANLAPVFSSERMKSTVEYLASDELKGRGLGSVELDAAADYIAGAFKKAGLKPAGDDSSYFQDFVVKVKGKKAFAKNVIGVIPGSNKDWDGESVIISAHYDHLGLGWPDVSKGNVGKIHHGADDNASGVAVLLELAQTLKSMKPKRSIIFAAFSGEEAGLLGAKYYVKNMQSYPANKAMGIINMDTVGSLGDKKLLVLNGASAREWKFIMMGTSFVTGVETEMVTQDITSSDHAVFIDAGVPGIHLFAGSSIDYHKPTDTADKIDYSGLVKVATVAREVLNYLAERPEPMSFNGVVKSASKNKSTSKKKPNKKESRRVSTGMMPDFAFSGKGVLAAGIREGSPAGIAGIVKGDIIIALAGVNVSTLRAYSDELKKHKVGEKIKVSYQRDGIVHNTELILAAR